MARFQANDKLILVKHVPGARRKRLVYTLTAVFISAAIAYLLGYAVAGAKLDNAISSLQRLSSEHQMLKKEEQQLRQTVANLESGRAIDEQAKQQIQDTISGLRSTVARLEKDVSFYKNIMAPSDNAKGLQVQNAEIEETSEDRRYAYKIVLAQVADNKNYVSGVVAINLIGSNGGTQEVIPLRDVSEREELGIKFRFRYFQNIEGELTLPADFIPASIQVVAQSKGKTASRIEQSFDWGTLTAN